MADTPILSLNDRWRLAYDPLQWVVQRRDGKGDGKSSGWRGITYPGHVSTIWRTVGEKRISVTATASATLTAWPEKHGEWLAGVQDGVAVSASAVWT